MFCSFCCATVVPVSLRNGQNTQHAQVGGLLPSCLQRGQEAEMAESGQCVLSASWAETERSFRVAVFFFFSGFYLKFIVMESVQKRGGGEGWGTCRGQRNTKTWPGPQLLPRGRRVKGKGRAEAGVDEGKGSHWLHSPRKHLQSLHPRHLPSPPRTPSLVLLLALVAPSSAPLDLSSPGRFLSRMMFRAWPQPPPDEGTILAFPASEVKWSRSVMSDSLRPHGL